MVVVNTIIITLMFAFLLLLSLGIGEFICLLNIYFRNNERLIWVSGNSVNGFSLLTPTIYVGEGRSFFQYAVDADNKLLNCSAEFSYNHAVISCELNLHSATRPTCISSFQVWIIGNYLNNYRI